MKTFCVVFALATAIYATEVRDQAQVIEKNGWTRTEFLDPEPFVKLSKRVQADRRDNKVVFQPANKGYAFKAENDDDNNACLKECSDDILNCFTVESGCDEDCINCVRVFGCEDRDGKDRCMSMLDAPCVNGDFQCIPSNVGVNIKKEPKAGKLSTKGMTKKGFFSLFQKENCANGFNLLPCDPETQRCQALEPCVSDDMSCCELGSLSV
eukprot:m.158876 g.158876  ORF g.158876 m.158876 type:complete len:210 (-) comp16476_c0_seq9:4472-5101(-)